MSHSRSLVAKPRSSSRIATQAEQPNRSASEVFKCCEGGKCILHGGAGGEKRPSASWSVTSMPKDIAEFAIDPAINFDAKATDIARHSMDETMDAFQKAKLGFKSNEINHKIFVTSNLDNLIRQNADRTFREIMPLFDVETKRNTDLEYHEAAAESAKKCFQVCHKHPVRAKQMLDLIVARIDCSDLEISKLWDEGMIGVIEIMDAEELQREIIPVVKERYCRKGASENAKVAAALMISKLVARLAENLWYKRLFPVIELLCADPDPIVRLNICTQLADISERMSAKDPVLNLLKKLSQDTDTNIRNATVHAICRVIVEIPAHNDKTKAFLESVIPVLKKSVKEAYVNLNHVALIQFSEYIGRVACSFNDSGILNGGNKLWFLDAFLHLSRFGLNNKGQQSNNAKKEQEAPLPTGFLNFRANNDFARRHSVIESLIGTKAIKSPVLPPPPSRSKENIHTKQGKAQKTHSPEEIAEFENTIRANTAREFPHFLKFAKPLVDFKTGLHPLVVDLMHDPSTQVRAAMAESLYPVMEILGTDCGVLHGEFVYALSDDDLKVPEGVLTHLASILKAFTAAKLLSPENTTAALVEIGGALLFCEEKLSQTNNWRLHAMILEQMSVLPFCIPGDYIYNNFVPIIFHRLLRLRQLPARVMAAYTIVSFLRHCRRSSHRDDIRKKIKETLAQGRSKQDRMLHLMMSQRIMSEFSRKYYRDHFFETNLDLTSDTVANVRLKAVSMMPDMKKTLHFADDETFLQKLEATAAEIKKKENDPDVVNGLETAMDDMQQVLVVFKNDVNYSKVVKTQEDLDDEAKEMEEAYIASLEPRGPGLTQREKRKSFFVPKRISIAPPPPPPPPPEIPPPPPPPAPAPVPVPVPPPQPKPEAKLPMSNLSRRALKTFSKMPMDSNISNRINNVSQDQQPKGMGSRH